MEHCDTYSAVILYVSHAPVKLNSTMISDSLLGSYNLLFKNTQLGKTEDTLYHSTWIEDCKHD